MDNNNKKQLTIWRVVSIVLIVALIAVSISWIVTSANSSNNATRSVVDKASQSDNSNPLSLWNDDAKLKTELTAYVKKITTKGENYVPEEDRIAVFDFDGTLFCETDPNYFDYNILAYRVLEDPDYKDKASDFEKSVANRIVVNNETGAEDKELPMDHGKAVATAFQGMTFDEFYEYVAKFAAQPQPSYDGMTRGEAFYRPMLQVIDYLEDNGFKVYIVSGTDDMLVRGIVKNSKLLNVPMDQIIGSTNTIVGTNQNGKEGLDYFLHDDKVVLGNEFILKNLKMNKVQNIIQKIGQQPILSFGNSSGDGSMDNYVINNNKYPTGCFMLCCDDLDRENGKTSKADSMVKLCSENNWTPVSMKNDWKTIYGEGVTYKGKDAAK